VDGRSVDLLEVAAHIEAAGRHLEVDDRDVGRGLLGLGDRSRAIMSRDHLIAGARQS